jgi:N-succinyldiaminopimelate aminotransferase
VIREPGDEVIVLDTSYDSYPVLLAALGAKVVYARRGAGGQPGAENIAAACTARTVAVVIVSPDNPLGVVCPREVLGQIAALCEQRDLTLIADHSLCEVNSGRRQIPLLPRLASTRRLSWIALSGTSKILGLDGSQLGALASSPDWRDAVAEAASPWFLRYSQYDLALLAAILSDPRFLPYRLQVSTQVAANHQYLRDRVRAPLTVGPLDAGSFCLIDAAGLGTDSVGYAALLRDRYRVLVVPVSWFPAAHRARPETRVRVALARPTSTIARLAAALNDSVTGLAGSPAW